MDLERSAKNPGSGRAGWSGKLNECNSLWMLKPKCSTDINVASITTQRRNVNRSAGIAGGREEEEGGREADQLQQGLRTPPPPSTLSPGEAVRER